MIGVSTMLHERNVYSLNVPCQIQGYDLIGTAELFSLMFLTSIISNVPCLHDLFRFCSYFKYENICVILYLRFFTWTWSYLIPRCVCSKVGLTDLCSSTRNWSAAKNEIQMRIPINDSFPSTILNIKVLLWW